MLCVLCAQWLRSPPSLAGLSPWGHSGDSQPYSNSASFLASALVISALQTSGHEPTAEGPAVPFSPSPFPPSLEPHASITSCPSSYHFIAGLSLCLSSVTPVSCLE